jgi:hypothetical protein
MHRGYPADVCLCRLAQPPVIALTSMDWRREVAFGPPRIARLKPSRSVRFTNPFTEPALDVRFPALPAGATTYPGMSFIPSSVAHPHESRSGRGPGPADGPGGELSLYLARRRAGGLRP